METYELIRTSVLTDPTLTDSEARLIMYLMSKPPGWEVWDRDIMRSLGRTRNWVKETKAKLRDRGILSEQTRKRDGTFAKGCSFNRNVISPLEEIPAAGKTSDLESTDSLANTELANTDVVTVGGKTANGSTRDAPEAKAKHSKAKASPPAKANGAGEGFSNDAWEADGEGEGALVPDARERERARQNLTRMA